MTYLDTHVVVWLFAKEFQKISKPAKRLINENDIFISPLVRLELEYLYEIQRINFEADTIINDLSYDIGLNVCDKKFNTIINSALKVSWTRDPFDRIIVAHASIDSNILLSIDKKYS